MKRTHFEPVHEEFRLLARGFFERECVPHTDQWEREGQVSREAWKKAGETGLLALWAPEEYGGAGIEDFRFSQVLMEELYLTGTVGLGIGMQNDVMQPYLMTGANEEQKKRWLPGTVTADIIWAIAMSEPGAGSDLQSIRTTAIRDGDHYVLNGSKTFITNGILADHIVVVAKTDPSQGARGISLVVVEEGMPGFSRGRKLDKVGMRSQDTAELFFSDVRVPVTNLLGEEGKGFYALMKGLPQERLGVGIVAYATMKRALQLTIEQVRNRQLFGAPLGAMQNTRFELAAVKSIVDVAESHVDRAVTQHLLGEFTAEDAAGLKLWTSEQQGIVVDRCLQLFGGYGFCNEYEIARLYRDSRAQRIYAGSNEVMKEIIGRSMKLDVPSG
jgi:alkylation response protein AidB-like acyl-CoA dehydrogenase